MKKLGIQLTIIIISFFIVLNVNAQELNGWIHEEGKTYYYENNQKVTGYKTIENENYFFKEDGVLQNNIVFLGDSITQGYNLSNYFNNYPVINSGISGNTTRDVLNNMYDRVYIYNPSKVIILIGTNDIFNGINKEETISNINKIISNIKTNLPNTKIYLESIYPINNSDSPSINHWMVGSRTNSFITSINNELKKIDGVTYINMYDSLILNGLLNLAYTYDGLHMNSNGYTVITNKLKPYVKENDNSSNLKDKWYYKNNRTYYYENNNKVLGNKTINGKDYIFDNELGYLYINKNILSSNSIIWLDYPNNNSYITDSLKVQGWFLTKYDYVDLNIKLDNNEIEVDKINREDVLKAYPKYSRIVNNQPGYLKTIDISNLSYDKHILEINLKDNNGVFKTKKFEFIKQKPKTLTNIDYPKLNEKLNNNIKIQGWVMSTANTNIKVFVDNTEVEVDKIERQDVLNIVKGYGDKSTNSKPGFLKTIDITNYTYGNHILKIDVYDQSNKLIQSTTRQFIKEPPKTLTNIDYPKVNEELNNNLKIQGWVMSTANTNIKVFVDNTEVEVDRIERQDVLNIVKGYGDKSTNNQPGFLKTLDITNLLYGNHILKIDVYDQSNKLIQSTTRQFIKKAPKTLTNIDYPKENEEKIDTLRILGWVMSEDNTTIKVYLDKDEIQVDRQYREDVLRIVKGYGDITTNKTPGFDKTIDINNLPNGIHSITIEVYNPNNILIQTTTRNFIKK